MRVLLYYVVHFLTYTVKIKGKKYSSIKELFSIMCEYYYNTLVILRHALIKYQFILCKKNSLNWKKATFFNPLLKYIQNYLLTTVSVLLFRHWPYFDMHSIVKKLLIKKKTVTQNASKRHCVANIFYYELYVFKKSNAALDCQLVIFFIGI